MTETTSTAPVARSLVVIGPNLADQSKGQFHVHATGCADVAKYVRQGHRPWSVVASSRTEVAEDVFGEVVMDREGEPGFDFDEAIAAELGEIYFLPCTGL
jgi:hypothetical protein